ncbi:MAG: DUF350 domain-containing protein [Cellvibrionales bacterium]|nr:DUF350 domain-containing protein [Cellvibrionales bacterium]
MDVQELNVQEIADAMLSTGSLLVLYLAIFFIANIFYARKAGADIKRQIIEKDNAAAAISFAGFLIGQGIIFIGSVMGPSKGLVADLLIVLQYGALGILLLFISHWINDKLILSRFCNRTLITEKQNIGVGVVQAASFVASGLMIAGSLQGEGGGIETAFAFFILGQLFLVIMGKVYDKLTPFDLQQEVLDNNPAASVSFAGSLIALGIILSKAASGDFISWEANVTSFLSFALGACLLLPVFRFFFDKCVISQGDLNSEIARDKNLGAGILELATTVIFTAVLCFLF